ncbi:phage/plasmid primase, P4 family [Methanosarcina sp. UBA289]|uniref:phage/plasmid primase, P4 family n=1 Tax=Methanosarcina sp. UBA289 TaxID=1915574 RepID=UPI0025FC2BF3|nr:phage/plasmid primase, P4 family [Methanosarcina sp. UBA289]
MTNTESNQNAQQGTTTEEMLIAARNYTAAGLIIHPLIKPKQGERGTGKAPFEEDWQNRAEPRSQEDLFKFWGRKSAIPYNIGLQCGERSGITVLDIDDYNPIILNELLEGINKETLTMSRRTPERGHLYFKYTGELQAVKKHFIGFEVLNNGSNAVLPPSVHYSGSVYQMNREINSINDFPEMPEELISRLKELFSTSDKLESVFNKCRKCIREKFIELKKARDTEFYHTSTGRDFTLALMIELYANGAEEEELLLACKIIFRDKYTRKQSEKELNYVLNYAKDGGKPWTCETIRSKCNIITIGSGGKSLCDACRPAGDKDKKTATMERSVKYFHLLRKGEQQDVASKEFLKKYPCVHVTGYGLATYREGIYVPMTPEETKQKLLSLIKEWGYAPTASELKNILEMIEIKAHRPETLFINADNPELVALDNGILNLLTGELTEYTPDIVIFNKLPVTYDPHATHKPIFDKFIGEVFEGNEAGKKAYQEFGGYCLYRAFPIHAFCVFIGTGGNGKSQLIAILVGMLGGNENITSYSMQDFFSPKEPSIIAAHHNKMANLSSETDQDAIKSTKTGKALTGGDAVTARKLYCNPFTFVSHSKALFSANSAPEIEDNTGALVDRMIPILLKKKFRGTEGEVLQIGEKIAQSEEMPAVLNWFIEGFKRLMEQKKFTRAQCAELDAANYARLSMPFEYFVEEYCYESEGFDTEYTTVADVTEALFRYRAMYPQSADFGTATKFKKKIESAFKEQGLRKVRYQQKKVNGRNTKVYMNLIIDVNTLNEDYEAVMKRRDEEEKTSAPLPDFTAQVEKTEQQKVTDAAFDMLARALMNYAKSDKYNGIVEDLAEFVDSFNQKQPVFMQRVGSNGVFTTAERLKIRGFR